MQRRSLLTAAAGVLGGGHLRPALAQVGPQPQATLACSPTFFGEPTVGEFAATRDLTNAKIRELHDEAVSQSQALRARRGNFQQLGSGLNVVLTYGQSNAFGTQAHPALPLPDIGGLWMLGASHRGALEPEDDPAPTDRRHIPIGDINYSSNQIYPLRSTVLNLGRTRVLSYMEAAVLSVVKPCDQDPVQPPALDSCRDSNGGEAIGVVFAAYLRQRIIAVRGAAGDDQHLLLVDCSEPDQTIASLNNVFFRRIETAFTLIATAAAREGRPVRHIATLFVQGSGDYFTRTTETSYKSELHRLFSRIDSTARSRFRAAQQAPAVGIIMQTSGRGVSGGRYDLSISRAQQIVARERNYPIAQQVGAEHGIHFTNNGARMAALAAARGAEDVLLQNQNHIDVAPIEPRPGVNIRPLRGVAREVLIPFTTPNQLCFVPFLQNTIFRNEEPPRAPLQLTMIREGVSLPDGSRAGTFGIIAYDDASGRVDPADPNSDPLSTILLERVFWVNGSDRVLCVRANRPWSGQLTIACGLRVQAIGRTNISTVDQRNSGFNYRFLGPNAGLGPPPPNPPITVMEPYENALVEIPVADSGGGVRCVSAGGQRNCLDGTPLDNTEFSLLFKLQFPAP